MSDFKVFEESHLAEILAMTKRKMGGRVEAGTWRKKVDVVALIAVKVSKWGKKGTRTKSKCLILSVCNFPAHTHTQMYRFSGLTSPQHAYINPQRMRVVSSSLVLTV